LVLTTMPGCGQPGRSTASDVQDLNMFKTREQQLDTRAYDVDGDGDRSKLSGHNELNNPPTRPETNQHTVERGANDAQGLYDGNLFADRVAQLAQSVPHVVGSVAVISGKVAILGLTIKKDVARPNGLDQTDENVIKQEVKRRVVTNASVIQYVYVTTDRAQVGQLNRIADGLRAGHPISTYAPQIHEMMRSMNPVTWE
jgi:hypothetical protein